MISPTLYSGVGRWLIGRVALTSVLSVVAALLPASVALGQHGYDVNCDDFAYQQDAQDWMTAHPGDPDGLDVDKDGAACESLPSRPYQPPPGGCLASDWVVGAIRERYVSLNGPCGFLGQPLTRELSTPTQPGQYNHFQGGSIYWSSGTGAWEVHGGIRETWSTLGWENSAVGFPITNELATPSRFGAYNHFLRGSIYWSPGTGAREVRGAIRNKWAALGWENSAVGFPITNERPTPTKFGAYNHFEAGSIYWTPATGAREVRGAIRNTWAALGWENSVLGFPISDELPTQSRFGAFNRFQDGSVYWSPSTGAHEVRGAILAKWSLMGWENSSLGFPTSNEYASQDGRRSDFEYGYIFWTAANGATVHYTGTELTGPVTARTILNSLASAPEDRTGYDRALFPHWIDADGNGCDTRAEVLNEESRESITTDANCTVLTGRWYSYYDSASWTNASDVDIDHVVALAEAWDSGARKWSATDRQDFANDLADPATLEAVTDDVNASKSDSDPAEWLPPEFATHCVYGTQWVHIKYRWRLTVDDRERAALERLLSGWCGDRISSNPPPRARP